MADTKDKGKHALSEAEIQELRREVEILELRARRKVALDSMRGEQPGRRQGREERKVERRKSRRKA
jgi:hypothetical protein